MLRDLGRTDVIPSRQGEIDPADSVFVVLLWFDKDERKHFEIGSIFLGRGEAQASAERYATEGSAVLGHEFDYATVVEIQTGQRAPKMQRHGDPYKRISQAPEPEDEDTQVRALQNEVNRLRALLGERQTTQV